MKCYPSPTAINKEQELLCQRKIANYTPSGYCPISWDGLTCWNYTEAGTFGVAVCPAQTFATHGSTDLSRYASKYCTKDGRWWINHVGVEWANYTSCVVEEDESFQLQYVLSILWFIGYIVSLVASVLAFITFTCIRSLRCKRTNIHQNLVLSFVLTSVTQTVWMLIIANPQSLRENSVFCRIVHVFTIYCLLTTYSWMFCEGCFLHTILVWTNISEKKLFLWLSFFGWGAPVIPVSLYLVLRQICFQHPYQLQYCWILVIGDFWWIYGSFTIALLLINFLFLLDIVRIVFIKAHQPLHTTGSAADSRLSQFRATVKALLILFPILGIQYILSSFHQRSGPRTQWKTVYEIIYTLLTAFQGFAVSVALCFINSEVQMGVRRKWQQWKCNINSRHQSFGAYDDISSFRLRFISSAFRGSRRGRTNQGQQDSARKLKENVDECAENERDISMNNESFV